MLRTWLERMTNAGRWLAIGLLACCHVSLSFANMAPADGVFKAATATHADHHVQVGAERSANDQAMPCCPDDGDHCGARLDKVSAKLDLPSPDVVWLPWISDLPSPVTRHEALPGRAALAAAPPTHLGDLSRCRTHVQNCTFLD